MADEPRFDPAHCRAARALLDLTQAELAELAAVGRMTVKRFEAGEAVRSAQAAAIRLALKKAGAGFLPDDYRHEGRPVAAGVVLLKPPK